MHVHQDVLYIGGRVSGGGSNAVTAWNGTTLSSVGSVNGSVLAMTSLGQDLLIGGAFTQVGSATARHIARWDGTSWSRLGPGLRADVFSFGEFNGTLYMGGQQFNQGQRLSYLKRWTGSKFVSLSAVGKELDGVPFTLFGDDLRGQLWAGGSFTKAGGVISRNIGVWKTLPEWTDVGKALARILGSAQLAGFGSLTPQSPLSFLMRSALPSSPLFIFIGGSQANLPFRGGTLVPAPDVLLPLVTDANGRAVLKSVYPAGGPIDQRLFMHVWFGDPGAPQGAVASNAITRFN